MDVAVTMLARAPEIGRVKTRLAAAIGEAAACAVHEALMLDAVAEAVAWLAARGGPSLVLALDGGDAARLATRAKLATTTPLRVEDQEPLDLGERMRLALERRLREGYDAALVIGSDCPLIREALDDASAGVVEADAVLVPATDGGFVLLGLRHAIPALALEGLPWGSSSALEATRGRLASLGLPPVMAGGAADVDDLLGLQALARRLAHEPPQRAPRSRDVLRRLALRAADPGGIRDTIGG